MGGEPLAVPEMRGLINYYYLANSLHIALFRIPLIDLQIQFDWTYILLSNSLAVYIECFNFLIKVIIYGLECGAGQ